MVSLDTNILIYAADRRAGPRHAAAHKLITAAIGTKAALTEQNLVEFLSVATRKAQLSLAEATTIIRGYLANFPLLVPTASVVGDVIALITNHKLSVWDARQLAVCAAHNCSYLMSEDLQDGANYGGVIVVDPFKSANAAIVRHAMTI
ncbi:MAG: PIN domain-containing protein [Rhizomicrobium sp.]